MLGNTINFGQTDKSTNCYLVQAGFTPAQMMAMDVKMDDAKILSTGTTGATTGKLRAADAMGVTTGSCVSSGVYNTANTSLACIGSFWVQD